jgi:hypothetical protein
LPAAGALIGLKNRFPVQPPRAQALKRAGDSIPAPILRGLFGQLVRSQVEAPRKSLGTVGVNSPGPIAEQSCINPCCQAVETQIGDRIATKRVGLKALEICLAIILR